MKDQEALLQTMKNNMDRTSYNKFENGERGISLYNFYAFSQFFNVSMDELLKD